MAAVGEPFWLLAEFFRCWHQTVDEAAWTLTDLANKVERTAFDHAREPREPMMASGMGLPLRESHVIAKNALYSLEALDSVLRCLGRAIDCHHRGARSSSPQRRAIQGSLDYTAELFHSTRHRILSVDSRMKNVINLVSPPPTLFFLGTLVVREFYKVDLG